ncbi:MAG TPA: SCO family protein [Steroidobacteraceae bacterium]|jgi:protein SCO1/2|nr:SCO family protein [Steroidobacteraceae bacterium]
MTKRSKLLSCVILAIAVAAGAAAVLRGSFRPSTALASGTLLAPARAPADFSLIDNRGRAFGPANLRGHWSLLFFGYTNCPDFCPTTLTTLAVLEKRLRASGATVVPQVVFVSLDAARDTPAQLNKYVPNFDPGFIGVTAASQADIEKVAKQWGIAVAIQRAANGNYAIDHSEAIFVVNPDGKLSAILSGPFSADVLQGDFERIVSARA